jgi:hypothetical protein
VYDKSHIQTYFVRQRWNPRGLVWVIFHTQKRHHLSGWFVIH